MIRRKACLLLALWGMTAVLSLAGCGSGGGSTAGGGPPPGGFTAPGAPAGEEAPKAAAKKAR